MQPVIRRLMLATAVVAASVGGGPAAASAEVRLVRSTVPAAKGAKLAVYATRAARDAATLVVVNGGPGRSHRALGPIADGLASTTLRVVLYDQRGVGGSTAGRSAAHSLAEYVADLEAVRRGVGARRWHVMGHSFGANVASAYAATHGRRVASLVLAGAAPLDPDADRAGSERLSARVSALQQQGLIPDPLPGPAGDDCSAAANALEPAYLADPRVRFQPLRQRANDCNQAVAIKTYGAVTDAARRAWLPRVARYRGRILTVFGAEDPFGAAAWAAAVHAEFPRASRRRVTLPDAGHAPWIENRRAFDAIRSFLT